MQLDNLAIWSLLTTFSTLVLFIQGMLLLRVLYVTHQKWNRYLLVLIPASASIWAFYIVQNISNVSLPNVSIHLTIAVYQKLVTPVIHAIHVCQTLTGMMIVIFVLMVFLEKKAFPQVSRPPVWVISRLPHKVTSSTF